MKKEDMKRVIKELAEIGCKAITFTGGGEPLCNPKVFPEAFHLVVDSGMKLGLVSNGSLVGNYASDILETCTFVRLSVDAGSEETYFKTHGVHSWKQLWRNIRSLSNGDVDLGLAFLVHPLNYLEVGDFCSLGMDAGVDYVQIRPVWMAGLTLSERIVKSVLKQIESYDEDFVYVRMDRFDEMLNQDKGFTQCLATPLVAVIGADLNVYLCCQFRGYAKYSFGNLKKTSFEKVWFGERRKEIIQNIDVNRCPPCRYRTYNKALSDLKNCDHVEFL